MSKRTYEAWRSKDLFEKGIGNVLICRHKGGGETEAGIFLVDAYCLGVKDGFFTKFPTTDLRSILERIFRAEDPEPLTPACARKLVEDAVAYAQSFGLAPNPDYKKAARVLGGLSSRECDTTFVFGKDGKPFYIQGPNDSPVFAQRVLVTLQNRAGEGKYNYILGGPPSEEPLDQEEEAEQT